MPRYTDLKSSLLASLLCVLGCAVMIGVAQLGTRSLDDSREHLLRLQTRQAPSAMALRELRAHLAELRLYQLSLVAATGNAADVADYDRRIEQSLRGARRQLALYTATVPSGEERRHFAQVQTELDAYLQVHRQLSAAVHAGDRDRARQLSTQQALPLRRALFADLLELDRINALHALDTDAAARAYAAR
ncbi:MCP four helix bundle domain-containing protein [Xanthomonas sp. NCPPB 2654]|uniref:MCP four helix bundle domain-containing protein n=1 Tax=unclassified Xanthomonas TaxID=2643310 RepID=UPI0021DFFC17|nr:MULTISPECIES: MCP four helix bundle domain-containing protein [unclassified Xanthomonas]MDL5366913.1 MCP four helix bundle domain-containing protein [Xanthomonas sp. NCPPB 2654]UYC22627.1 MCP four helix bundle domain-containing protein [Xanthomonas sp. CFBP 8443]